MSDPLLPSAFAELEQYARIWCLPTESERWDKRMASTMAEMREFYDAFFPDWQRRSNIATSSRWTTFPSTP
jgi:hypothetical protein